MARHRETISLVDDQGKEHEFDLLDVIEVAQQRYALLRPAEEETDAVIFRMEDDETLTAVEDDEEFARVAAALEDREDDETGDSDEEDEDEEGEFEDEDEEDEDDAEE